MIRWAPSAAAQRSPVPLRDLTIGVDHRQAEVRATGRRVPVCPAASTSQRDVIQVHGQAGSKKNSIEVGTVMTVIQADTSHRSGRCLAGGGDVPATELDGVHDERGDLVQGDAARPTRRPAGTPRRRRRSSPRPKPPNSRIIARSNSRWPPCAAGSTSQLRPPAPTTRLPAQRSPWRRAGGSGGPPRHRAGRRRRRGRRSPPAASAPTSRASRASGSSRAAA